MKKIYTFFLLVSHLHLNAFSNFKKIDQLLDDLDPIESYQRLAESIRSNSNSDRFHSDGCSGELSKVWNESIYPHFIQPHLGSTAPDFIPFPAEKCCRDHDRIYFSAFLNFRMNNTAKGGVSAAELLKLNRKTADKRLKECVGSKKTKAQFVNLFAVKCSGENATQAEIESKKFLYQQILDIHFIAKLMYVGVRIGGRPCSNHEYRFGYGYDNCKGHGESTLNTSLKIFLDLIKP